MEEQNNWIGHQKIFCTWGSTINIFVHCIERNHEGSDQNYVPHKFGLIKILFAIIFAKSADRVERHDF